MTHPVGKDLGLIEQVILKAKEAGAGSIFWSAMEYQEFCTFFFECLPELQCWLKTGQVGRFVPHVEFFPEHTPSYFFEDQMSMGAFHDGFGLITRAFATARHVMKNNHMDAVDWQALVDTPRLFAYAFAYVSMGPPFWKTFIVDRSMQVPFYRTSDYLKEQMLEGREDTQLRSLMSVWTLGSDMRVRDIRKQAGEMNSRLADTYDLWAFATQTHGQHAPWFMVRSDVLGLASSVARGDELHFPVIRQQSIGDGLQTSLALGTSGMERDHFTFRRNTKVLLVRGSR